MDERENVYRHYYTEGGYNRSHDHAIWNQAASDCMEKLGGYCVSTSTEPQPRYDSGGLEGGSDATW